VLRLKKGARTVDPIPLLNVVESDGFPFIFDEGRTRIVEIRLSALRKQDLHAVPQLFLVRERVHF
jgi:hypothetical protein